MRSCSSALKRAMRPLASFSALLVLDIRSFQTACLPISSLFLFSSSAVAWPTNSPTERSCACAARYRRGSAWARRFSARARCPWAAWDVSTARCIVCSFSLALASLSCSALAIRGASPMSFFTSLSSRSVSALYCLLLASSACNRCVSAVLRTASALRSASSSLARTAAASFAFSARERSSLCLCASRLSRSISLDARLLAFCFTFWFSSLNCFSLLLSALARCFSATCIFLSAFLRAATAAVSLAEWDLSKASCSLASFAAWCSPRCLAFSLCRRAASASSRARSCAATCASVFWLAAFSAWEARSRAASASARVFSCAARARSCLSKVARTVADFVAVASDF
mmetsp:Transcript_119691/g.350016  ORF Transcript_119691/g.350016 Transcript_119691/m.350016 type:complete len:344 (-) Transcript_119691:862-1893(-)